MQDAAERSALEAHSRLLAALARGMSLQEEEQHLAALAREAAQQQRQQQQQAPAAVAAAGAAAGALVPASGAQNEQQSGMQMLQQVLQAQGSTLAVQPTEAGAVAAGTIRIGDYLNPDGDGAGTAAGHQHHFLDEYLIEFLGGDVSNMDDSDYSASEQPEVASSSGLSSLGGSGDDDYDGRNLGGSRGGGGSRRLSRRQRQLQWQRRQQRSEGAEGGAGGHNLRPRRQRGVAEVDGQGAEDVDEAEDGGVITRTRRRT